MTLKKTLRALLAGMAVWGAGSACVMAQTYPTLLLQHEQQIDNMIEGMSLEEKIEMLHGKNMFSSSGIPRMGISDMEYADGPFGIREEMEPHSWNSLHLLTDSATFFPTGSALAATWSTDWAYAYGRGMSREARLRGKDMILGPAINIQRIPTGGRTYEYLSEDPFSSIESRTACIPSRIVLVATFVVTKISRRGTPLSAMPCPTSASFS